MTHEAVHEVLERLRAGTTCSGAGLNAAIEEALGATGDPIACKLALYGLAHALIRDGRPEDAEAVAGCLGDWPPEVIEIQTAIALLWCARGDLTRARGLLVRSEALASEHPFRAEWQRAEAFGRIAAAFSNNGDPTAARHAWTRAVYSAQAGVKAPCSQDAHDAMSVLLQIAADLARSGEPEWARRLASSISSGGG